MKTYLPTIKKKILAEMCKNVQLIYLFHMLFIVFKGQQQNRVEKIIKLQQ